jgi:hypothetical protein
VIPKSAPEISNQQSEISNSTHPFVLHYNSLLSGAELGSPELKPTIKGGDFR